MRGGSGGAIQVTVHTSDLKFAGTDADVSLTLYGNKGTSPVDLLLSTSKNNFERSTVDVFDLPPMADLGELTQVGCVVS